MSQRSEPTRTVVLETRDDDGATTIVEVEAGLGEMTLVERRHHEYTRPGAPYYTMKLLESTTLKSVLEGIAERGAADEWSQSCRF